MFRTMNRPRPTRLIWASSLLLLAFFLRPTPTGAYEEIVVKAGGTISGRIEYVGPVPKRKQIKITDDVDVCGKTPKYSEALVVSKTKGIQNVVVSLVNISKGKPWGPMTVQFIQRECQYFPHVLLVPVGGTVEVINDDPLTHNIHTFAFENPTMNKGQPKTVRKISTKVEVPELIKVACDIHRWMKAWWKVVDHPYYTVTDAEGNFTLTDVLPGIYQLQIWHKSLGKIAQEVTVESQKTTTLALQMKAKKRKRIKIK